MLRCSMRLLSFRAERSGVEESLAIHALVAQMRETMPEIPSTCAQDDKL